MGGSSSHLVAPTSPFRDYYFSTGPKLTIRFCFGDFNSHISTQRFREGLHHLLSMEQIASVSISYRSPSNKWPFARFSIADVWQMESPSFPPAIPAPLRGFFLLCHLLLLFLLLFLLLHLRVRFSNAVSSFYTRCDDSRFHFISFYFPLFLSFVLMYNSFVHSFFLLHFFVFRELFVFFPQILKLHSARYLLVCVNWQNYLAMTFGL